MRPPVVVEEEEEEEEEKGNRGGRGSGVRSIDGPLDEQDRPTYQYTLLQRCVDASTNNVCTDVLDIGTDILLNKQCKTSKREKENKIS